MLVDDEFDRKPTGQLLHDAATEPWLVGRARSLFALSRRVTPESLSQFVDLLDLEQNRQTMVFGAVQVREMGTIALMLNGRGKVRAEAERLWFAMSFEERHYLKTGLSGFEPDELPLLDHERAMLAQGMAVATKHLGSGEWEPRPTLDGKAVVVKPPHPDERAIFVDPDGSFLLHDGFPTFRDAQIAFAAGERTPIDESGQAFAADDE